MAGRPTARGAGVAAVVSAAALAVAPGPARAAPAPVTGAESYGLVASNANFVPGDTPAERTAAYRRLYDAGVRAIRVDINWIDVEPEGPPSFDFDFRERDRELAAITAAGLKVIGLLAYGHPDHSTGGGFVSQTPFEQGIPPLFVANAQYFPPDDPADFARYARATAERYGDEVIAWEIWNEQNAGVRFWPPREDPAAYAELLCAAYREVKAADPDTPALYGGVFFPSGPAGVPLTSGPDFLEATYAADPSLGRCFDVLAYHPYAYPFTAPELDVPPRGSVLSAADQMRAVLERHGDGDKPVWITEVGWPTNDRSYGVPEEKQGQYVARMQVASFAQGLPVLTWFTYGDLADPSGANQEVSFGFFRADGSAKPSYHALATFARVFEGARFRRDRSSALGLPPGEPYAGGRGFALEFARGRRRITAVWLASESAVDAQGGGPPGGSFAPASIEVALPVSAARVAIVTHLGESRTQAARDGRLALELGPAPLYVVDRAGAAQGGGGRPGEGRRRRDRARGPSPEPRPERRERSTGTAGDGSGASLTDGGPLPFTGRALALVALAGGVLAGAGAGLARRARG